MEESVCLYKSLGLARSRTEVGRGIVLGAPPGRLPSREVGMRNLSLCKPKVRLRIIVGKVAIYVAADRDARPCRLEEVPAGL